MPTQIRTPSLDTATRLLWLSVLGSPMIWAAHLQIVYSLVQVARKTKHYAPLYATTVICCLLVLTCGYASLRHWRRRPCQPETLESSSSAGVAGFMSAIGIAGSVFFAITVLATGLAVYFFKANWG